MLANPQRLARVHALRAGVTLPDAALDRLTRLAARVLGAPVALVSVLNSTEQLFVGRYGVAEPWRAMRQSALSHSFCQYVVAADAPLVVMDARQHPLVAGNAAIDAFGVIAYAGVPIHSADGLVLGALCAIDCAPRAWSSQELATLEELAAAVEAELALRLLVADHASEAARQAVQRRCLEALATDRPLQQVLTILAEGIAQQLRGGMCAVMLRDRSANTLLTIAAPALPPAYIASIGCVPIGPLAGSCGTAAHINAPVIASDIATDPLWEAWRAHTLSFGLRACWSQPIRDAQGEVLGTFACWYRQPHTPDAREQEVVAEAAHLAAVTITRAQNLVALRASEANLAALFANTSDCIWSVDRDHRLVTANDAFRECFGAMFEVEPAIGASMVVGLPPQEAARWSVWYDRALRGERFSLEHTIAVGATTYWHDVAFNPIRAGDLVVGVSVFGHDITERKRAEAQRLEHERAWQATQRLESLGVLAGGIAHDFNNLLMAVRGHAELAASEPGVPPSVAWHVERLLRVTDHAADLVRQILAYSGRQRPSRRPVDLRALLDDMARLLRAAIPRYIALETQLAPALPLVVADATQLRQVLLNLLVNAAEAIGDARGQIALSLATRRITAAEGEPGGLPPGPYVELAVSDTGRGMDDATLARVVEPFFTTKAMGRGLGLSMVHGIVRGHRGAVQVQSALGHGTTFRVLIPCSARHYRGRLPGVVRRPRGAALRSRRLAYQG
jgi:PAS domain S-box-containing protein